MANGFYKSFRIDGTQFSAQEAGGRLYVKSIHPYDDTEYHWAFMCFDGTWKVYRAGRYQITFGSIYQRLSPEQVAVKLLALDEATGLMPRMVHN